MDTSNPEVDKCLDQVSIQLHDTKISTLENDCSTIFGLEVCASPMTYAAYLEDFDENFFTDPDSEEEGPYDNVVYDISESDLAPFTSILNSKKFGMPTVVKDRLPQAEAHKETDNDADDERMSESDDPGSVSAVDEPGQDYNFESSSSD